MQYVQKIALLVIVVASAPFIASSFSIAEKEIPKQSRTTTSQRAGPDSSPGALEAGPFVSRRSFLSVITTAFPLLISAAPAPARAVSARDALVDELNVSLSRIETLPGLLGSAEWDKVRTVLKTPPVNQLWNLGESQNTLVKLAKETGDFEIMEIKDELAISLQMTDQYSYDNVFIYYQPGNGKVKVKEPMEMANKAISQLKEALNVVGSS